MKTLSNHIILYDAECPMCSLYTKAFVGSGMLDNNGRKPYQEMLPACPLVDRQRAVNEIALINTQTGEVEYGVVSLFKVVANSFPLFKALFEWKPFIWIAQKAYAFISYNRRVIVPGNAADNFEVQPGFKLKYRVAYLLFTWLMVGFILTQYAHLLTGMVPVGNVWREYAICGGQILFQGIIVSLYANCKKWDYLGNMMTISFAGALLLLPCLLLAQFVELPALVYTLYFLGVAGLMFLEHIRRSKLLGLGWLLTITWMAYRLGILLLILN
ncbi:DUF393 domain-containing protein [Mucilaginibacter limnophilus]|uniref:DUF393 domain-containing protein n=1 Tax=Mucilaginibacter limnophilus TaxID=1932778 RepID=A0A3S2V0C7_9SPHI|nr:DUF393 domain-containing protein [Mucilaginibacter limnophilus]RVT98516.1 DUF393 domain-containing protein [Mucilaginibacter limnophilus]